MMCAMPAWAGGETRPQPALPGRTRCEWVRRRRVPRSGEARGSSWPECTPTWSRSPSPALRQSSRSCRSPYCSDIGVCRSRWDSGHSLFPYAAVARYAVEWLALEKPPAWQAWAWAVVLAVPGSSWQSPRGPSGAECGVDPLTDSCAPKSFLDDEPHEEAMVLVEIAAFTRPGRGRTSGPGRIGRVHREQRRSRIDVARGSPAGTDMGMCMYACVDWQ